MVQKGLWQQAANDMNASANRTGRHKMTPTNVFSMVNSARLTAQMGVVSEPQLPLVGPPAFPPMTLVATQNGTAFALNVVCNTSLPYQICAQATSPCPAGLPRRQNHLLPLRLQTYRPYRRHHQQPQHRRFVHRKVRRARSRVSHHRPPLCR